MSQTRKQQAVFPDLPRDSKFVNDKGEIMPAWDLFFQQLVLTLQINLKPEGFVIPPQSAANIANIGNTSASIGNIIYDSTNNAFKGIILVSLGPPIVTSTKTFTIT